MPKYIVKLSNCCLLVVYESAALSLLDIETTASSWAISPDRTWLAEHRDEGLPFQVGRFGFCLTLLKDVLTAPAARKYLPSGLRSYHSIQTNILLFTYP